MKKKSEVLINNGSREKTNVEILTEKEFMNFGLKEDRMCMNVEDN
jgi:hypothetical protein